jgi:hypothetical protein
VNAWGHYLDRVQAEEHAEKLKERIGTLEAERESLIIRAERAEEMAINRGAERDALREFIAHTFDYYGERMPSQWKAHARATLGRSE